MGWLVVGDEVLITTESTDNKLINISVVSVVLSASVVKIVIHDPPNKPWLDRAFMEFNLLDPVAILRSNAEFWC